jgi:uncharacterized protein (TIGR03437 family)
MALPAQTFTTLHSFDFMTADGAYPNTVLVQGSDGGLYGTTAEGGANYWGTVFKIAPSGTLTTLYSFAYAGYGTSASGLVQATDGNLYGTTYVGGANEECVFYPGSPPESCGTVFKITLNGALTTLYSFCAQSGCTDGELPDAALVQAANGDFYGTTEYGGGLCCDTGTVFKITPSGTLTTLYSFPCSGGAACADGEYPASALVQATNGDFYGTTGAGGATLHGTVFQITPSGTATTLYSFCTQSGCVDGTGPSGLMQATDGNFYGTTSGGGANEKCVVYPGSPPGGCGTVFKITPSGALTTLYSFCADSGCTDGLFPEAGLVQATDGNFYGTTVGGGADEECVIYPGYPPQGCGTVFKITPSGTLTTLHSFCSQEGCADGSSPGGLAQATNGTLYGTTSAGGDDSCPVNNSHSDPGCGTVFSLSVGLAPFVKTLPTSGNVGAAVQILGTNLTGATSVTFNGTAAAFTVISPSLISTTVPTGAATGQVQVKTPIGTLLSNAAFVVQAPLPPFTVALSTAGQVEPFAAQSIVSAYVSASGADLATGTASASSLPLPTSLDGTTVTVTDSAGAARLASLFYVSPLQVNFEIPAGTAVGTASVSIQSQSGTAQTATIQIGNVSPGLFELNGAGLVAAWVLPVISGAQQPLQPVYQIASGAVVPLPINLGLSTNQVYLEMYGTGIRNASNVTATVGSFSVPVLYAGAAPGFAGEDQVNIGPLPQALAGAGSVNIVLTADGQAANTVNVVTSQ